MKFQSFEDVRTYCPISDQLHNDTEAQQDISAFMRLEQTYLTLVSAFEWSSNALKGLRMTMARMRCWPQYCPRGEWAVRSKRARAHQKGGH